MDEPMKWNKYAVEQFIFVMYKCWKLKALLFEVESVTNVVEHKSTVMQELLWCKSFRHYVC